MFRLSLVTAAALLSIPAVYASVVSTSVFPNSACAGATSLNGLVGVGRVTLANGQVETHCGCPPDNLPDFTPCELSPHGESVCNSVLNLDTGSFAASCGIVSCSGADCPTTVVNSVVVDQDDCFNSEKGAIGIVTVDGESKCGCASDSIPSEFSACPAPSNGRATCVSVDSDFLGMAYSHKENVECGVVCDEDYFLTPGGSCTKLAKREYASHSAGHSASHAASHGPSHTSGSGSPTTVPYHPHNAHTTTYGSNGPSAAPTTTSYSYKHHHPSHVNSGGSPGPSSRPPFHDRSSSAPAGSHPSASRPIKVGPSSSPHGSQPGSHGGSHHGGAGGGNNYQHHTSMMHHHGPSSRPAFEHRPTTTTEEWAPVPTTTAPSTGGEFPHSRGPTKVGPSAAWGGPGKVGPSQVARPVTDEIVPADTCAQDERTCPLGTLGDFSCVRLDDVTECGGCSSTGEAQNCLEIEGAASVSCLRNGCVVRSCQTGFFQTDESTCEREVLLGL
ncbi:uncharacterized protein JCM6883_004973 [Sporobolomyces salmoneus]|uniref:uncharacterized protein n=1 Tax=Sporobolomyces salmoneus TaxID=183962 RepID=UPI0031743A56